MGALSPSPSTGARAIFRARTEMAERIPMKPPSFCFINFAIVVMIVPFSFRRPPNAA